MQIEGDTTRKNLIQIISQYNQSILKDPKKLKNLLLDLNQGIEKKEVNIVCNSLDDMTPFDLIKNKDTLPYDISAERSIRHLQNSYGITEDLARWTVDTWAIALHVISEEEPVQLNRKSATVPIPSLIHKTRTTSSGSPPIPTVNPIPGTIIQKRVNNKSSKKWYLVLGLFIISILLFISGNTGLGALGVFALMASMGLFIIFIGMEIISPSKKIQTVNVSQVSSLKNQITGKYEGNKFVLLLAVICFAMPWIIGWLIGWKTVQSSSLFDQVIAWSSMLWIVLSFALLATYGGYLFTSKK